MPSQHEAAVSTAAGSPLTVIQRDTPEPGPHELLIENKAIAMNPVDHVMRDGGMPVPHHPAVLGDDVAGIVVKTGSAVPSDTFAPGSRVMAMASAFYENGSADHGAFQKFSLVRAEFAMPLPDHFSFEEGAIMPLAALTALSGFTTMGLTLAEKFSPADKHAILIWGASSSVGTLAVQTAKLKGFVVYATAGARNLEYVKQLGADAVFDYKAPDVVAQIVERVKQDGTTIRHAQVIVNDSLQQTLDVLAQTKGDGDAAYVAHAPLLPEDHPTLENTEIKFTWPPADYEGRCEHARECFRGVLEEGIKNRKIVPSPRIQVIPGGIGGINDALDTLRKGVSATKVVVSV